MQVERATPFPPIRNDGAGAPPPAPRAPPAQTGAPAICRERKLDRDETGRRRAPGDAERRGRRAALAIVLDLSKDTHKTLHDCRGRKRVKASEVINDGASTPAAGRPRLCKWMTFQSKALSRQKRDVGERGGGGAPPPGPPRPAPLP
ncbi:hypothetical protein EVAR_75289_1 [Eumeta japonica]|uniref:Uncharacterized protein n=1 Tax=Eumeta variegata TaxID=151549 RepID=A0A4C1YZU4_EUMVA|nr:hypothetical protein EVAR_75289_1 [Eumeta japonica]